MSVHFLRQPDEIVLNIISKIDGPDRQSTLIALCSTHRRFTGIVQEELHKNPTVRLDKMHALARTILHAPQLAKQVKTITILKYGHGHIIPRLYPYAPQISQLFSAITALRPMATVAHTQMFQDLLSVRGVWQLCLAREDPYAYLMVVLMVSEHLESIVIDHLAIADMETSLLYETVGPQMQVVLDTCLASLETLTIRRFKPVLPREMQYHARFLQRFECIFTPAAKVKYLTIPAADLINAEGRSRREVDADFSSLPTTLHTLTITEAYGQHFYYIFKNLEHAWMVGQGQLPSTLKKIKVISVTPLLYFTETMDIDKTPLEIKTIFATNGIDLDFEFPALSADCDAVCKDWRAKDSNGMFKSDYLRQLRELERQIPIWTLKR